MSDEPDLVVIVAMPVSQAGRVTPGSVAMECGQCSTRVWIAPSSMAQLFTRSARILCMHCFADMVPPEFRGEPEP